LQDIADPKVRALPDGLACGENTKAFCVITQKVKGDRMSKRRRIPTYGLHKPSGQAIVTLPPEYMVMYLGPYGSVESRRHYDRIIAEWLANGRAEAEVSADDAVDPRDEVSVE
jgi:hypothetical protein